MEQKRHCSGVKGMGVSSGSEVELSSELLSSSSSDRGGGRVDLPLLDDFCLESGVGEGGRGAEASMGSRPATRRRRFSTLEGGEFLELVFCEVEHTAMSSLSESVWHRQSRKKLCKRCTVWARAWRSRLRTPCWATIFEPVKLFEVFFWWFGW